MVKLLNKNKLILPKFEFFGVRPYKIRTIFQLAVRTKISNLYVAFSGIVRVPLIVLVIDEDDTRLKHATPINECNIY